MVQKASDLPLVPAACPFEEFTLNQGRINLAPALYALQILEPENSDRPSPVPDNTKPYVIVLVVRVVVVPIRRPAVVWIIVPRPATNHSDV